MPPPPKVTPSKELKTENIINLFDAAAAAAPDISVTSPTEVSDQLLSTNSHSPLTSTLLHRPEPFSIPSSGLFFLLFLFYSILLRLCIWCHSRWKSPWLLTTEWQKDHWVAAMNVFFRPGYDAQTCFQFYPQKREKRFKNLSIGLWAEQELGEKQYCDSVGCINRK